MELQLEVRSHTWKIIYYSPDSYIIYRDGTQMYNDDADEFINIIETLIKYLSVNEDNFIYSSMRFSRTKTAA